MVDYLNKGCYVCGFSGRANHICWYENVECRCCDTCYYDTQSYEQAKYEFTTGDYTQKNVSFPDVRVVIILFANEHCDMDLLVALLTDHKYLDSLNVELKVQLNKLYKRLSSEQLVEIDRRLMLVND